MASCSRSRSEKNEGVRGAREAMDPAARFGVPLIGLAGELNMMPAEVDATVLRYRVDD